jgi:16S rRNA (cytosine1402-N4)-methyltransferase
MTPSPHQAVLLEEVLAVLELRPGLTVADLTVGYGGHAERLAQAIAPDGTLFAFDRDVEALAAARERLAGAPCRVVFVHDAFSRVAAWVPPRSLHAALADLGVSSPQVDRAERGFSYRLDGPLDMRMDPTRQTLSARDVVNAFSEDEIADILYRYGEERASRRIARRIVLERRKRPIETTAELAAIVHAAMPGHLRRGGPHPARRTFQALRIFVNRELEELTALLDTLPSCLTPDGRLAVITFHSLEDRIVKRRFRAPPWQAITAKPVLPSRQEVVANPRARSAKLRAARVLAITEGE